jgi:excinuclease ABC subunit C
VDGGKGQLSTALEVLDTYDLSDEVPVAALAKQDEVIFLPGGQHPVQLPARSEAMYLVQRVRDEAHRFANQSHRKRRSRMGTASILDDIPGIGPARRKLLLDHFGSLDDLRKATAEEIASVPGIPFSVGQAVKAHLA